MILEHDYISPTPHRGWRRIRIYSPESYDDSTVVSCTEPEGNPGMSITNAAERIARELLAAYGLPVPLVWIEHYEHGAWGTPEVPETFDLVLFSIYEVEDLGIYAGEERKRIGKPSWKALDRRMVKTLVGEEVRQ